MGSVSEIVSCVIAVIIAQKYSSVFSQTVFFLQAGLSGLALLFLQPENIYMITFCILFTKSGISSAFNLVFVVTQELFPICFSSQVFGFCNIIARFATIVAPLIAEVENPNPLIFYFVICMVSAFFSNKLRYISDHNQLLQNHKKG